MQVGKNLSTIVKEKLKSFLCSNLEVFDWKHEDMIGIGPKVSCHHLKIDLKTNPIQQKRKASNSKRYKALKDDVKKLIANRFNRESIYLR